MNRQMIARLVAGVLVAQISERPALGPYLAAVAHLGRALERLAERDADGAADAALAAADALAAALLGRTGP